MTTGRETRASTAWDAGRYSLLILFAVVQLILAASDSLVTDEPESLRDGATILERGSVAAAPEHPPLVKLLGAAMIPAPDRRVGPPAAAGDPFAEDAGFAVRARLKGLRLLRARLPSILISTAGLFAFGSLFALISPASGLAATALLGGAWPYLAHGHYVTTDVAPAAFLLLCCWCAVSLRGLWSGVLAGLMLGAALLSKFSAPYLAPFILIFAFRKLKLRDFLALLLVCAATVLAVESYAVRGMSGEELAGLNASAFGPGGFERGLTPPAPALQGLCERIVRANGAIGAYVIGFLDQSHRSASAPEFDYWAGRLVQGSQPLYPAATLLVKNDLPLVIFALLAAGLALRRRRLPRDAAIFLSAGAFYMTLAARSHLHYGVRHLLPLVVLLCALGSWMFEGFSRPYFARALLGAHVAAACLVFPHFVSARNLTGRAFLRQDALYDFGDDWGQDLGRQLASSPGPIVYESILVYRAPDWKGLFPDITPETPGSRRYLVDRLIVDLRDAQRGHPASAAYAQAELALLGKITLKIDWLDQVGRRIPAREPTFVLYEVGRGRNPP
jgi:hypothetical protein